MVSISQNLLSSRHFLFSTCLLILLLAGSGARQVEGQPSAGQPNATAPVDTTVRLNSRDYLATFIGVIPEPALVQALHSLPGIRTTQLSPQSFRLEITDPHGHQQRRFLRTLDRAGVFALEFNRPVFPQLTIDDPESPWYLVEPTRVATHRSSPNGTDPNRETALDITRGSPRVTVGIVDFNTDPIQDQNPDLDPPNFRVEIDREPILNVDNYHGTATSSTINARTANGSGSSGVCPDCSREEFITFIPDFNSTRADKLIRLLEAARLRDLQVVNNSWGADPGPALHTAIRALYNNDAILTGAAGNYSYVTPMFPANYSEVIAVGALTGKPDGTLEIAAYSNRGAELVAVGTRIPGPVVVPGSNPLQVLYRSYSGTSFATPQVSGIAALVLSAITEAPQRYPLSAALSPTEKRDYVRELLRRTATDIGDPGVDRTYGSGIVNAHEALRTLAADNRDTIADDIPVRFTEWTGNSSVLGAPWVPAFVQTIQGSSPVTDLTVQHGARGGQCFTRDGFRISSPRVEMKLENANLQIAAVEGATATVTLDTDVLFTLQQKIRVSPSNPLECALGWDEISFPVAWKDQNAARQQLQMELHFELTGGGYTHLTTTKTTPQRDFTYQMPSTVVSGLQHRYDQFLLEVEPSLELMQEALVLQMTEMTQRILNRSLSFAPTRSSEYTRVRTTPSLNREVFLPRVTATHQRAHFAHEETRKESLADFGVQIAKSNPRPGITASAALPPTGALPNNANQAPSQVSIPENFYNSTLQNLFSQGAFSSRYVPELQFQLFTRTLNEIDGVTITADISAREAPTLEYRQQGALPEPYYGDVHIPLEVSLVVRDTHGTEHARAFNAAMAVPISRHSVYKHHTEEIFPESLSTQYEDRLTPDIAMSEVEVFHGTSQSFPQIFPGDILRIDEIETLLRETAGYTFGRTLAALSSWQTDADKEVGVFGCLLPLDFNSTGGGVQMNGQRPIRVDDLRDCWDINEGSFAPRQAPPSEEANRFSIREITFEPRVRAPVPQSHGTATYVTMEHPLGANHPSGQYAGAVIARFTGKPEEELHTSFHGVTYSPFQDIEQEEITLYEEIWQAFPPRVTGAFREASRWVPQYLSRATETSLINIARNRKQMHIASSCLPRVTVEFSYRNGAQPARLESGFARDYEERSIFEPEDQWQEMLPGACDGTRGTNEGSGEVDDDNR
ncbi:S8 family peptidase [bacterium]|nr:S8 family peptidase [bacterium]